MYILLVHNIMTKALEIKKTNQIDTKIRKSQEKLYKKKKFFSEKYVTKSIWLTHAAT